MGARFSIGIRVLVCSAFYVTLALAQTSSPLTGQWTMGGLVLQDRVLFSIQCCGGTGFNVSSSMPVPLAQFRGLTRAQLDSGGAVMQFQMVRDAGTLQLQGYLDNGKGGGTFMFVPNVSYANEMRSLGYSDLSIERMFMLALHDISPAFVREMNALGIHPQSTEQLVTMGIHNVTPDFVRELRTLGYNASAEQLVTMQIHGITPDFIRKTRARGLGTLSIEQLVSLKIHGILN